MKIRSSSRRRLLKGVVAGSLFAPFPFARTWAQTDGAIRLQRVPKFALVVGNSNYKNVAVLRNPANDANAIATAMRGFGFEVTQKLDASRPEMEAAIQDHVLKLASTRGVGLFYYAGHGLQLSWTNYLVPVEAAISKAEDVQAGCVDLSMLMTGMRRAANPLNVIILDACRENPFERDFRVSNRGLTQMDAPNDTLLAYATAPGNVASDGAGSNGLYTESLLKEIRVPEARLEDVFKRVRLNVRRATAGAQVPWESTSLEEDFWFLPPKAIAVAAESNARREAEAQARTQLAAKQAADAEAERKARAEALAALEREERERVARAEAERQARAKERAQREREERESAQAARRFKEEQARWNGIKDSRKAEDFYAFLLERPSGYLAEQAQFRLDQLEKTAVQPQAGADGVRQLPSGVNRYMVGDELVYDVIDRYTKVATRNVSRVIRADDRTAEFSSGAILDQMGGILKDAGGSIKDPVNLLTPANLAVGKHWQSAFTDTRARSVSETFWNYRVTAYEEVTVPAGTFKAFKIEGEGYTRFTQFASGSMRLLLQRWVDPATMNGVRTDRDFRHMSGQVETYHSAVLVSAKRVPR